LVLHRNFFAGFFGFLLVMVGGCGMGNLSQNLSTAIMNQNDPEIVRTGAPAYLLLIDSFIEGDPDNENMLRAGAGLYGVYAAVFVEDPERAGRLAQRARNYGERALCERKRSLCGLAERPYEEFVASLEALGRRDVPVFYAFTVSWLISIKANSSDWAALADLPKVEAALERIVELDETYERGTAHLYLGILQTLRPPALGGHPEEGRRHFERALALSGGKDLGVKVEYARGYARLLYDRELHDRLLREVLAAEVEAPGLTLLNVLAREQAGELLRSGEDYF
jgi:TRAP transporter T-component